MIFLNLILRRAALRSIVNLVASGLRFLVPRSLRGWVRGIGTFLFVGALDWIYDSVLNAINIWQTVQTATYAIVSFDWNQSDASIKQQIAANNNQIAQLVGRFAGSGLVRVASVGAAYGAQLKYPVVAGRLAVALAEDTTDQLRGEFVAMAAGLREIALENALLTMILTFRTRRWFGQEPRPNDGPHFSFANEVEKRVEALPHPLMRNFVEGLLEGAEDAFWDVGYIVAGQLDDIVAANRFSQVQQFGPQRALVLTPDTRSPDEKIVLAGSQANVEQTLDLVVANHKLIHNRDIGQIVAQPVDEYIKARPQLRKLCIVFRSRPAPPWVNPDGTRVQSVTYNIPDCKTGLTWQQIKNAASRYQWGKFRATAQLNNQRQMQVYGASEQEARDKLMELVSLSTAEILKLTVAEEKFVAPQLIKRSTMVYPAYAKVLGRRNQLDGEGRTMLDGRTFTDDTVRFPLYTATEPIEFKPII
jgi:hypothetical protein